MPEGGNNFAQRTQVDRARFDAMLRQMLEPKGVSDVLFMVGKEPQREVFGQLETAVYPPFSGALEAGDTQALADILIDGNERLEADMVARGACDTSYSVADLARFRVNIFMMCGTRAIVMRKLSSEVPEMDALNLPPVFREVIKEKNGIILVTGSTGSGKTTTLAAMLNEINKTHRYHILALEDPIEFRHPHKLSTFSQRELGRDFPDFASGLRSALRQAPKVILVGEIRDRETMEIALTASETGHVVYSTLHTVNAGQTINRIIGMFSKEEEQQLRQRLADTIRYVISQRLVSKISGGRLLVTEVMGSSLRSREALLYGEGENRNFQEIIEAGSTMGWHSFDQCLLKAFDRGDITEETAILFCNYKNKMRRDLDTAKKLKGIEPESSGVELRLSEPMASSHSSTAAPPPLPKLKIGT